MLARARSLLVCARSVLDRARSVLVRARSVLGCARSMSAGVAHHGFAQIHLPPDADVAGVRRKLVFDRFYLRHRSARLDLFILLATGLKVFGLRRVYRRTPSKRLARG